MMKHVLTLALMVVLFASNAHAVPVHVGFNGHFIGASMDPGIVGTSFAGYLDYDTTSTMVFMDLDSSTRGHVVSGSFGAMEWNPDGEPYVNTTTAFDFWSMAWGKFLNCYETDMTISSDFGFRVAGYGYDDKGNLGYSNYFGKFDSVFYGDDPPLPDPPQPVPEPSAFILFATGIAAVTVWRKKNLSREG